MNFTPYTLVVNVVSHCVFKDQGYFVAFWMLIAFDHHALFQEELATSCSSVASLLVLEQGIMENSE